MPTNRRFENGPMDVPDDFDPGYDLQTKCDCGNEEWEPGDLILGHSNITDEQMTMKANLCTSCKAPQMWISRQYLKIKREEENERRNHEKAERKMQTRRLFLLWKKRVRFIGRHHSPSKRGI